MDIETFASTVHVALTDIFEVNNMSVYDSVEEQKAETDLERTPEGTLLRKTRERAEREGYHFEGTTYLVFDLAHSGYYNSNCRKYTDEALKKTANKINEKKLALLRDHNHQDIIGTLLQAEFQPLRETTGATFNDEANDPTGVLRVGAVVNKLDVINDIRRKLYNYVSIGGGAKKVSCNICGQDARRCDHWRGAEYTVTVDEGRSKTKEVQKTCGFIYEDIEVTEGSVVYAPGDEYASVHIISDKIDTSALHDNKEQNTEGDKMDVKDVNELVSAILPHIKTTVKDQIDDVLKSEKERSEVADNKTESTGLSRAEAVELKELRAHSKAFKRVRDNLSSKISDKQKEIDDLVTKIIAIVNDGKEEEDKIESVDDALEILSTSFKDEDNTEDSREEDNVESKKEVKDNKGQIKPKNKKTEVEDTKNEDSTDVEEKVEEEENPYSKYKRLRKFN